LCWFHLERLLDQWKDQFALFNRQILRTRFLMRGNGSYLSVSFERLKPKIEEDKKGGQVFHACPGCGYEAAEVDKLSDALFEQTCRICGLSEGYAEIDCPAECGNKIHIKADHGSNRTCPDCGHVVTAGELEDILGTEYMSTPTITPPR
jgi:hypothetical protein